MVSVATSALTVNLGRRTVVRGISVNMDGGQLIGILGPNGAGKSTFVRALLGLLPHEGTVSIDDADRASLPGHEVARRIAYLPQGQVLHWPVTVERLVALGRLPHLAPLSRLGDEDRAAIERALARTDVAHLRARVATELSGGERARVLLARALAVEAPALIADEPLASLDPAHQIEGMELLRAEADAGALVIAVLHDLTLAARFCDRVLVMADGELKADGAPGAVLTPALLADVYGIAARYVDGLIVPLDRLR
ncbi:ABC transporter ATP-binding protein [uncultured Sphingomonas sp.]|uniref:ABC transporter ATP-binding protein n=1 Tax=unclassified Sphingomonas TaxID=196159 RepID=UPI0025D5790E|nr:ABC transporter ATP-binding protein [uncultured Sphingomonas sp.]